MTVDQAFVILGITDEIVDEIVIKKAFYEAARLTHPDSNPNDENAIHKFKMIKEAYEFLNGIIKKSESQRLTNYSYRPRGEAKSRSEKYKNVDAWDFYEEADRRYEQEKKRQAERKAAESIRRREEYEKLRRMQRQQQEELHRQQERLRQEEIHRQREQRKQQQEGMNMSDRTFQRREWDKRRHATNQKDQDLLSAVKHMASDFYYRFMFSIVKLGWLIEFVSFTVISIACIAYIISVCSGGYRNMSEYSRSIATLFWWTMAISLSWKITKIIREYYGDKIILSLLFLVMMELGLFGYKMLGDLLNFAGENVCNIILITLAAIYEAVIYSKIIKSLRRKTDKSTIVFVSVEIILCFGTGIIFSVASMIMNAKLV